MKLHRKILSLAMVMMMILATIQVPASARSPFRTHTIPGSIVTAEFDFGEQGETYSGYKTNTHEGKYDYRGDGAMMNVYSNSKWGASMGFNRNEWMKYTVNVKEAGTYSVVIYYAAPYSTQLKIGFDNDAIVLNSENPAGEDWLTEKEYEVGLVTLSEGQHELTLTCNSSGFNFNAIKFEKPSTGQKPYAKDEGGYRATTLPAIIQAEDFDLGAAGTISADGKNDLRKYRVEASLDIGLNEAMGNTFLRLNQDEAANYTVYTEVDGVYSIDLATATTGTVQLYIDDSTYPINVTSDVSSNFQETRAINVHLPKGEHVFRVAAKKVYELDYIKVLKTDEEGIEISDLEVCEYPIVEQEVDTPNPVWKELYVSTAGSDSNDGSQEAPFATIERANEEVAAIRGGMEGDIIINVAGGMYKIDEALKFDVNSGGANGYDVIYRGDENNKPVVHGGTRVTGWTQVDDKIWKAPLDVEDTRTLYIGDFAARRARSKYKYYAESNYITGSGSTISDGFKVESRNFPSFAHPEELEVVWELEWTSNRSPVDGIDYGIEGGQKNGIRLAQPSWYKFARMEPNPKQVGIGSLFHLENAKELLDETGEFYFDKANKEIYYYPYKEENLNAMETWVGVTEDLMTIQGESKDNKIKGFALENIDFKYTAWNDVSEVGVYVYQADSLADPTAMSSSEQYKMPAQIEVDYAENIKFDGCTFFGLGSTAISMTEGVVNSEVVNNNFIEIGGCAVSVGESYHDHNMHLRPECERSTYINVSNNIMWRVANEFRACPAIQTYFVKNFTASHNDIQELPYTGISVGWGWQNSYVAGIMANNTVSYNKISDTCSPTHDGSQIYTLGAQQNTAIHDNWLLKSGDYRGGVYNDEGSTNMTVYNNVIEDSVNWLFSRANVSLKNILVYDNYTDTERLTSDPDHVKVSNTTVVKDGNWPDAAKAIMNNAGITDKERLNQFAVTPEWRQMNKETTPMFVYNRKHYYIKQAEDFNPGWNVGYFNMSGRGVEAAKLVQNYKDYIYRPEAADVWINVDSTMLWNFAIGNTKAGDWFAYDYEVPHDGEYQFQMYFLNGFPLSDPHAKVTVTIDGTKVLNNEELVSTGDNDWSGPAVTQTFEPKFYLTAGVHHVRIDMVDNGWHFDWWALTDGVDETPLGNEPEYDEGVYEEQFVPVKAFVDIVGHWAEDSINKLRDAGIINGVSETEFAPERSLSLYETTWLALRTLGVEYNDSNWKQLAVENGLLTDVNEADGSISRQRLAYNVMNAYTKRVDGYETTVGTKLYTDMDQIDPKFEPAVRAAHAQGFLTGDDTGAFRPASPLTRAEAATVFLRLYEAIGA